MAMNQKDLHELGRQGEKAARLVLGGKTTKHKAPFDIVDFSAGYAYEVKTMSSWSKDKKIHILDSSYARKVEFADKYDLKMSLIAVVIYSTRKVEIFEAPLVQSIRISQMTQINKEGG